MRSPTDGVVGRGIADTAPVILTIRGDTAVIPLGHGLHVIVDTLDLPTVLPHRWRKSHKAGERTSYARTIINGKTVLMHRLISAADVRIIDHINRNGLDNRRQNLRPSNHALNLLNSYKFVEGLVKGLTPHKGGFQAQIAIQGELFYLGLFKTREEAAAAYVAGARIRERLLKTESTLALQPRVIPTAAEFAEGGADHA